MNTEKISNNVISANVIACRPPSKIGCVITPAPAVTQCRPPSKIGCVITNAPVMQGEAAKPVVVKPVRLPACGEIYATDTGAPDISLMFAVVVAGIFGNCR